MYIINMFTISENGNVIFLGFSDIFQKKVSWNATTAHKNAWRGKPSLIVSDIFHLQKYDTNEVDREQKALTKIN